jgi:hypothetical protein
MDSVAPQTSHASQMQSCAGPGQIGLHFHPNRIPAIYAWGEFGAVGGLLTYGPSLAAAHRQVGIYTAKILKSRRAPPGRGAITF